MSIIPSGKLRVMQAQALRTNPDEFGISVDEPRSGIEQDAIPASGSAQPPENQATPEQVVPDQVVSQPQNPSPEAPAPQTQVNKEEAESENGISKIRDTVFKYLTDLGVQPRQLESLSKQLYAEEVDLDTNTIIGHFMIPTRTAKQAINSKMAQEIARKIGQQFGLALKMKIDGKNFRVDFRSAPVKEIEQGGSSFDELHPAANKKACTLEEMLDYQRSSIIKKLEKIAQK